LPGVGRQVQVGEQDLVFMQVSVFGGEWFLDFINHIGGVYIGLLIRYPRAGFLVHFVGEAASQARAFFHYHRMARVDEAHDAGRQHRNPVLLGLYFLGDSDYHVRFAS
jgi:hypothetical protein